MANNVAGWVVALAQVIYAVGWCKEGWKGFSWLAFRDIWAFARLTFASSIMICLEHWYNTSIVILAGQLPNPVIAVGSFSICLNFQGWQFMMLLGINAAISVRVSNKLGMWHPRAAK
ncbi:hypothetical protein L6164_006015 [Bauhinia variegata]|uniref:Uncharacterized protein n=1 Tax=Bauhinia variegata TaxID=167791 RepID=A0ACB9PUY2_BAUVA|nr:hypothetical protein L6164_006015 [Bauhinia variegata]